MAHVLVIGAGVFGSLAAEELRDRGHVITLSSRRSGVDARDAASVGAALQGVDAVLHTAGPFHEQVPNAAHAATRAGVPYVDISDDRAFSAALRRIEANTPVLTGMSTTPAVAEALATIARVRAAPQTPARCAMFVGGANRQGPATMRFAAHSRARGRSIVVDVPGVGRRRAFPANAYFDGLFFVAVGGLGGWGWRFRALTRLAAPLAAFLPRGGNDTSGAIVVDIGSSREALFARAKSQRLAILPAIWAIEEALAGRAPQHAALPSEWVEPERIVAFLVKEGFERVSA